MLASLRRLCDVPFDEEALAESTAGIEVAGFAPGPHAGRNDQGQPGIRADGGAAGVNEPIAILGIERHPTAADQQPRRSSSIEQPAPAPRAPQQRGNAAEERDSERDKRRFGLLCLQTAERRPASAWMRGAPESGLATLISRISPRISAGILGR